MPTHPTATRVQCVAFCMHRCTSRTIFNLSGYLIIFTGAGVCAWAKQDIGIVVWILSGLALDPTSGLVGGYAYFQIYFNPIPVIALWVWVGVAGNQDLTNMDLDSGCMLFTAMGLGSVEVLSAWCCASPC